jgi:hypothetical protein
VQPKVQIRPGSLVSGDALAFATVAAGLAFFRADLSATTGFSHSNAPFSTSETVQDKRLFL